MIKWTASGAVEQPNMVQIRVQRSYPGRVRAGAPVPTRSMSEEELLKNLWHFGEGLKGPRTHPCSRLVLSGVGVATREDLPRVMDKAREWGFGHIVLHVGVEDLDRLDLEMVRGRADCVVVPLQPGRGGAQVQQGSRTIRACQDAGVEVVANTVLSLEAVSQLEAVTRRLTRVKPRRASFTFPFPIAGGSSTEVVKAAAVKRALTKAVPALEAAGISVSVKGLPACYLPGYRHVFRKSANRWYVDADHQVEEALLFFPDVVGFSKTDACRFCVVDASCDGFFATYLRREGFPALASISDSQSNG